MNRRYLIGLLLGSGIAAPAVAQSQRSRHTPAEVYTEWVRLTERERSRFYQEAAELLESLLKWREEPPLPSSASFTGARRRFDQWVSRSRQGMVIPEGVERFDRAYIAALQGEYQLTARLFEAYRKRDAAGFVRLARGASPSNLSRPFREAAALLPGAYQAMKTAKGQQIEIDASSPEVSVIERLQKTLPAR